MLCVYSIYIPRKGCVEQVLCDTVDLEHICIFSGADIRAHDVLHYQIQFSLRC